MIYRVFLVGTVEADSLEEAKELAEDAALRAGDGFDVSSTQEEDAR